MGRRERTLAPSIFELIFRLNAFICLWGVAVAFLGSRVVFLADVAAASVSSSASLSEITAADTDRSPDAAFESAVAALNIRLPKEFHAWGACEVGAWNFSRTIIENRRRNASSNLTVMENSSVLHEKRNNLYSTVTESITLLAGKTIPNEPKNVRTNFWGLSPDEAYSVKELPAEILEIDGIPLKCRVVKFISSSKFGKRETVFWINETTAPYLLRKERAVFDVSGEKVVQRRRQKVESLNFQFSICGRILNVFKYSVVATSPSCVSNSEVIASLAVPGRIVTQITREKDLNGNPLQDISTELLDFGTSRLEYQSRICRSSIRAKRLVVIPTKPFVMNPANESAAGAPTGKREAFRNIEVGEVGETKNLPTDEKSYSHTEKGASGGPGLSLENQAEKIPAIPADVSGSDFEKSGGDSVCGVSVPGKEPPFSPSQKESETARTQGETDALVDGLELTGNRERRDLVSEIPALDTGRELEPFEFCSEKNQEKQTISLEFSTDSTERGVLAQETENDSDDLAAGRVREEPASADSPRRDRKSSFALRREDFQKEVLDRRREKDFLKGILLSEMDFQRALEEIEKYSRKEISSDETGEGVRRFLLPGDRVCFRQFRSYWQTEGAFQERAWNSVLDIWGQRFSFPQTLPLCSESEAENREMGRGGRSFSPIYDSTLRQRSKNKERRNRAVSIKNSRIISTKSIREDLMREENKLEKEELKKAPPQEGILRKSIQFLIQKPNDGP